MTLGLDTNDIKALSGSGKTKRGATEIPVEKILEKLKIFKSSKRRQPFDVSSSSEGCYERYLSGLSKFAREQAGALKELQSPDGKDSLLKAVKVFRLLVTASKTSPPINELIDLNVLPKLVACLKDSGVEELQFEAAWALTNMAVGTSQQTRFIIEAGALPALIQLLTSESERVKLQAVWTLGNIAGDLDCFREHLMSYPGALAGLLHVIRTAFHDSTVNKCLWALENLIIGDRSPHRLLQVIPVLTDLLSHRNTEVVLSALGILGGLAAQRVLAQEMVSGNLLAKLEHFLATAGEPLLLALRTIANIARLNEDTLKDRLLERNILQYLRLQVDTPAIPILRTISDIISNLSSGHSRHIQALIKSQVLPNVWPQLRHINDHKIQHSIVSTFQNFFDKGDQSQIIYAMDGGIIQELCYILKCKTDNVLLETLYCLDKFLSYGEKESFSKGELNRVACEVMRCGGLEALEKLLSHEHRHVYSKAYQIIVRHYDETEATGPDLEGMHLKELKAYQ